jgi:hypothetical protein
MPGGTADDTDEENDEEWRPANDANGREHSIKSQSFALIRVIRGQSRQSHGLGWGVGRGLGVALGGLGVGVVSDWKGAKTLTPTGEPVLKKLMVALLRTGAALESNRKLYNVAHRIALAFGFCANVSVLHVSAEPLPKSTVQGVLLYPASPTVPSCGHPGCCGGA